MKFIITLAVLLPFPLLGQIAPDTSMLHRLLVEAEAQFATSDYWQSIETSEKALAQFGENYNSAPTLAVRLLKTKAASEWDIANHMEALADLDLATSILKLQKQEINSSLLLEVWSIKAHTLYDLGERETSKQLLDSIVLLGSGLPPLAFMADVNDNLGTYFGENRQLDSALLYFTNAKDIRDHLIGENPLLMARSWLWLGVYFREAGRPKEAIEHFERGMNLVEKHNGNTLLKINLIFNIGIGYSEIGEFDEALRYFEEGLRVVEAKFGNKMPHWTASYYKVMGDAYRLKKDFQKSIEHHKKALLLLEPSSRLPVQIDCAIIRQNMALSYSGMQDYDTADSLFKTAIQSLEKLREEDPSVIYYILLIGNSQSNLLIFREMYREAIDAFRNNIENTEKIYGPQSLMLTQYLNNLGLAHQNLHEFEAADSAYARAMAILELGPVTENGFSNIVSQVEWSYLLWNRAENDYLKYTVTGDIVYLERAYNSFDRYTQFLDFLRGSYREEGTKIGFADENKVAYEKCLQTLAELNKKKPVPDYFETIFNFFEKGKAMVLLETVHQDHPDNFNFISNDISDAETRLRSEVQTADDDYFKYIVLHGDDDVTSKELKAALFKKKNEYNDFLSMLKNNYTEYYELKYKPKMQTLHDVQQSLLEPKKTLLEYFVGDSSIFIFTVGKGKYNMVEVKKDFPLEDWVKQLQQGLYGYYGLKKEEQKDSIYERTIKQYAAIAPKLYEKLIAPVQDQLTGDLIIVPDGVLGYVPFEALLKAKPTQATNFATYPFLVKDHKISYCYSATLLREMKEKRHKNPPTKPFVAFAPFYKGSYEKAESTVDIRFDTLPDGRDTVIVDDVQTRKEFNPLKASGEEVAAAARIWHGDYFLNADATEQRFYDLAGDYRIVHLSTHGIADSRVGDYSYLAFAEQKDGIENEFLYVRDLYNTQLNADLVVLSACETAQGELQRGEGIISLARAFAYAGAKSIVTTLWTVDDSASKDLTKEFYLQLKKGKTKEAALQAAKLKLVNGRDARRQHPFFWAGFIGVGDMSAMK